MSRSLLLLLLLLLLLHMSHSSRLIQPHTTHNNETAQQAYPSSQSVRHCRFIAQQRIPFSSFFVVEQSQTSSPLNLQSQLSPSSFLTGRRSPLTGRAITYIDSKCQLLSSVSVPPPSWLGMPNHSPSLTSSHHYSTLSTSEILSEPVSPVPVPDDSAVMDISGPTDDAAGDISSGDIDHSLKGHRWSRPLLLCVILLTVALPLAIFAAWPAVLHIARLQLSHNGQLVTPSHTFHLMVRLRSAESASPSQHDDSTTSATRTQSTFEAASAQRDEGQQTSAVTSDSWESLLVPSLLRHSRLPVFVQFEGGVSEEEEQAGPTFPATRYVFLQRYDRHWIVEHIPVAERRRLILGPAIIAERGEVLPLVGARVLCSEYKQLRACQQRFDTSTGLGVTCMQIRLSHEHVDQALAVFWSEWSEPDSSEWSEWSQRSQHNETSALQSTVGGTGSTDSAASTDSTESGSEAADVASVTVAEGAEGAEGAMNMRFRPVEWGAGITPTLSYDDELQRCPILFEQAGLASGMGDQLIQYARNLEIAAQAQVNWLHAPLVATASHFNAFLGLGMHEPDLPTALLQLDIRPQRLLTVELQTQQPEPMERHAIEQLDLLRQLNDAFCRSNTVLTAHLPMQNVTFDRSRHSAILVKGFPTYPLQDPLTCRPELLATMRRKYCMARVLQPVPAGVSLLARETAAASGVLQVAVHYRAGDLAFGTSFYNKHWSLDELIAALDGLDRYLSFLLAQRTFPNLKSYHFHIISQTPALKNKPPSMTWQEFFQPVISHYNTTANSDKLVWHVDAKSETSLEALVDAPIIIRSSSGFALAASMLRWEGVDVTNEQPTSCLRLDSTVRINITTGDMDWNRMTELMKHYYATHHNTFTPTTIRAPRQCQQVK